MVNFRWETSGFWSSSVITYLMWNENSTFFSEANDTWQNLSSVTLLGINTAGSKPISNSDRVTSLVQFTCRVEDN